MIRPTRTAGGVAALALALTVVALLIASPAAALAAGSLAIFLLWRGWRFERDLAAVAASLTVNRAVDRTILRQGAATTVRVTTTLTLLPGMEVRIRDVPPAVAAGEAPLCRPGETATYTIRIMAPGRTVFGGVILKANDAFYSRDLLIRHLNAPSLQVFPAGTTAAGGGRGTGMGETEVDRRSTLDGQSVRGFRPYRSGDDPGSIDWKVSAKRGTLYIRQLTGLEGGTPLIVVDLPARDVDPETFARFSMAVSGAVEGAIRSRDGCSLLVVTSGEVVRFIPKTRDLREALQALGGLAPVEPRNPLYRAPGPAVLAARPDSPPVQGTGRRPASHDSAVCSHPLPARAVRPSPLRLQRPSPGWRRPRSASTPSPGATGATSSRSSTRQRPWGCGSSQAHRTAPPSSRASTPWR
ncbi:DUF58 domain-containing protein [Methanoculleus bourgensis]|uniref:DUF58 domain-containing protein n=1 Tax=Methanoculleus bourgensis TaxID=83986 RepID=A0A0X3BPC6_9EURY|nr:DUF58 domain-containing protein [Methanoculleus bourgensis]CVK34022.1 exported protein of unknown function [Methanoculleus bourgensis]